MKKIIVSEKDFKAADRAVKKAVELIKKGYQKKKVIHAVKKHLVNLRIPFTPEDAYVAARLRIRAKEKFGELSGKLFFDESGYRYSTPAVVARYRAERLRDYSIADVSCGSGMQLAFFGINAEKVTGVELDKKRAYLAALNVKALGAEAEVYHGNAYEYRPDEEVIFSDPARPEREEVRTVKSLQPNPLKLAEVFSDRMLVFELPPQMPPERVDSQFQSVKLKGGKGLKGEKEYVSFEFKLNRLAFYSEELSSCDVSAVSLPSGERVTSEDEAVKPGRAELTELIAEVDRTVVHAGLLENLLGKLGIEACVLFRDKRRTMLGLREVKSSAFLRYYRVVCTASSLTECKKLLKKVNAKKVTLRFSVDPGKYWDLRKDLEEGLSGEKHVYLFRFDGFANRYIICERADCN